MSRRNSQSVFAGTGTSSGVRSDSRRSAALRNFGLKLLMPRRARPAFNRPTMRVHSPTMLKRVFIGWLRGERDHCRMVAIATQTQEDATRAEQRAR